jgi:hypothetical protein
MFEWGKFYGSPSRLAQTATAYIEAGAGFGQQNGANCFSFESGSHKKRPNVSVAWVGRRKADNIAVLFPNGHSRIGYKAVVIIIGNPCNQRCRRISRRESVDDFLGELDHRKS